MLFQTKFSDCKLYNGMDIIRLIQFTDNEAEPLEPRRAMMIGVKFEPRWTKKIDNQNVV